MSDAPSFKLRWATRLIVTGLFIELVSLFGLHRPWGFLLFAIGGCSLIGLGVVLYVATAVTDSPATGESQ